MCTPGSVKQRRQGLSRSSRRCLPAYARLQALAESQPAHGVYLSLLQLHTLASHRSSVVTPLLHPTHRAISEPRTPTAAQSGGCRGKAVPSPVRTPHGSTRASSTPTCSSLAPPSTACTPAVCSERPSVTNSQHPQHSAARGQGFRVRTHRSTSGSQSCRRLRYSRSCGHSTPVSPIYISGFWLQRRERAKAVPGCCARRFYSSRMASSGCALPPASPSVTHVSLSIPQAVRLGTGGVRREQWRMQSMYQPYGGVRTVYALRGWWKRTNDLGFGDAVFSCV